jgi:hypothetical protein
VEEDNYNHDEDQRDVIGDIAVELKEYGDKALAQKD